MNSRKEWIMHNLFNSLKRKYPDPKKWKSEVFSEITEGTEILPKEFESYVKTVFDTPKESKEDDIVEKIEYSQDDVDNYFKKFVKWLNTKDELLDSINSTKISEFLNQFILRDTTKRDLLKSISLRAMSTKNENFSYSVRNLPQDNISEENLINGEVAFRKLLKGKQLSDKENWNYHNLLTYMSTVNPSYHSILLNDNEFYILQRKVDTYRKLTPSQKSEMEFSSVESPFKYREGDK